MNALDCLKINAVENARMTKGIRDHVDGLMLGMLALVLPDQGHELFHICISMSL